MSHVGSRGTLKGWRISPPLDKPERWKVAAAPALATLALARLVRKQLNAIMLNINMGKNLGTIPSSHIIHLPIRLFSFPSTNQDAAERFSKGDGDRDGDRDRERGSVSL